MRCNIFRDNNHSKSVSIKQLWKQKTQTFKTFKTHELA